jgi:mannose-1-phosphate guanylyltransferase / mannose-6-phosphate isomerase
MNKRIVPVIMCGGVGTRLWPISRENRPKQFVPLAGSTSAFQHALRIVGDGVLFAKPVVITHIDFRFVVAEQIRACGCEAEIILEPAHRDSAAAVAIAAEFARSRDSAADILVLATDHMVRDPDLFRASCREAAAASIAGHIVTFGVRPTEAATNYGYIRPGAKISGTGALSIEAFFEKPDGENAVRVCRCGLFMEQRQFHVSPEGHVERN